MGRLIGNKHERVKKYKKGIVVNMEVFDSVTFKDRRAAMTYTSFLRYYSKKNNLSWSISQKPTIDGYKITRTK